MKELIIDKEFQKVIPQQTDDEHRLLEESTLSEGVVRHFILGLRKQIKKC